jgi:hypothetical protein
LNIVNEWEGAFRLSMSRAPSTKPLHWDKHESAQRDSIVKYRLELTAFLCGLSVEHRRIDAEREALHRKKYLRAGVNDLIGPRWPRWSKRCQCCA